MSAITFILNDSSIAIINLREMNIVIKKVIGLFSFEFNKTNIENLFTVQSLLFKC